MIDLEMRRGRALIITVLAIAAIVITVSVLSLRSRQSGEELAPRIDTVATMTTRGEPAGVTAIVDQPAPAFRLPTLDGDTLSMDDLKGRVVVINFWATWCAPCLVEIPDLIGMQEETGDEGVRFVGIALDVDNVEAIRAFAEDAEFNYPVVLDDGDVADDFGGIYALPTTILINREGVVVRKISGLVTRGFLMPLLEELAEADPRD